MFIRSCLVIDLGAGAQISSGGKCDNIQSIYSHSALLLACMCVPAGGDEISSHINTVHVVNVPIILFNSVLT